MQALGKGVDPSCMVNVIIQHPCPSNAYTIVCAGIYRHPTVGLHVHHNNNIIMHVPTFKLIIQGGSAPELSMLYNYKYNSVLLRILLFNT